MKITISSAPLTLEQIAAMVGGTVYSWGMDQMPTVRHICTDSREVDGDTLFCAIRGERVDGHSFLPAVSKAGCVAFLCEQLPIDWALERPRSLGRFAAVVVYDTVAALCQLAAARREAELPRLFSVAVTGSVGKTTTKEMLSGVLAGPGLYKKAGNFNSTIGLPLSVMEIPPEARTAILEMGMSGRGEIAAMSRALRPQIAIITNVGSSHLQQLGTRENIAAAKLEIMQGLPPGGTLLINGDEPLLRALGADLPVRNRPSLPRGVRVLRLTLSGEPGADYAATHIGSYRGGSAFDLVTPQGTLRDLWIPEPGVHLVWAAAFAAIVGLLTGRSEQEIREGLAAYRPDGLRQTVEEVGGITLIRDYYNAAPESTVAALTVLTTLGRQRGGRLLALLGDMRELGEGTPELHRRVGERAVDLGVDHLITVGPLAWLMGERARVRGTEGQGPRATVESFVTDRHEVTDADCEAMAARLAELLREGDTLLIKGSRALRLERVAHRLTERLIQRNG